MNLYLKRFPSSKNSTIGVLYLNDVFFCHTLEDIKREGEKVFGQTAIPSGKYTIIIDFSPHFNKNLPHILNVDGFTGVRIHTGNKPEDTEGCILVGEYNPSHPDWISDSKTAFDILFAKMQKETEITLIIA